MQRLNACIEGLFVDAVFNFYTTRLDQAEAGIEYNFVDPDITISAEYFRLIPWFDADSIFNVFDIRAYDEVRARMGYQINDDWYTSLRFGVRMFGADDAVVVRRGNAIFGTRTSGCL